MIATPTELRDCPAPAKLNLFLHVVGQRADGYHLLQTLFQLIDWCDTLHFKRRGDSRLVRTTGLPGVSADNDLVIRAARLLQTETGCRYGADIAVEKRLPMGGGVGGGSSDAATTLLALNRLWELELPRARLMALGLRLGADVPFFLFGQNAFAEGIGATLTAMPLPTATFVVIHPRVHLSTSEIFSGDGLTRDTPRTIIADFPACQGIFAYGRNDLQAVAERKSGEVARALAWLRQFSPLARMTGSGACVFAAFDHAESAREVAAQAPPEWEVQCVAGLPQHPLVAFAV